MSNIFVWVVTKCDSIDQIDISTIYWSCEKFDESGKVGESVGSFTLNNPINFEDFAKLTSNDLQNLIFEYVDKSAVEAAIVSQGE